MKASYDLIRRCVEEHGLDSLELHDLESGSYLVDAVKGSVGACLESLSVWEKEVSGRHRIVGSKVGSKTRKFRWEVGELQGHSMSGHHPAQTGVPWEKYLDLRLEHERLTLQQDDPVTRSLSIIEKYLVGKNGATGQPASEEYTDEEEELHEILDNIVAFRKKHPDMFEQTYKQLKDLL